MGLSYNRSIKEGLWRAGMPIAVLLAKIGSHKMSENGSHDHLNLDPEKSTPKVVVFYKLVPRVSLELKALPSQQQ